VASYHLCQELRYTSFTKSPEKAALELQKP
jgi:hypothetical protein